MQKKKFSLLEFEDQNDSYMIKGFLARVMF